MKRIAAVIAIVAIGLTASGAQAKLPGGWKLKAQVPRCVNSAGYAGPAYFDSTCTAYAGAFQPQKLADPVDLTTCYQFAAFPTGPWSTFGCVTEGPGTTWFVAVRSAPFTAQCATKYRTIASAGVDWEGSRKPAHVKSSSITTIC